MHLNLIKFSFVFLVGFSFLSCSKKWKGLSTKNVASKTTTWVFVMAGQSNMSGSGNAPIQDQDKITNKRILTLSDSYTLQVAKAPIHAMYNLQGLDCGMSFANELLKHIPDSVNILLVPCAVGNSSISQWIGDSTQSGIKLFSNFKKLVEVAKQHGSLKAILWHQGESDATNELSLYYSSRLAILINMFRSASLHPHLPILIGELGSFSENPIQWRTINSEIYKYTKTDSFCKIIPTSDLGCLPDKVHFNTTGQRKLGIRNAQLFIEHFYKK